MLVYLAFVRCWKCEVARGSPRLYTRQICVWCSSAYYLLCVIVKLNNAILRIYIFLFVCVYSSACAIAYIFLSLSCERANI